MVIKYENLVSLGQDFLTSRCELKFKGDGSRPASETISKQAGNQLYHMVKSWWHDCKQGSWFLLRSKMLQSEDALPMVPLSSVTVCIQWNFR